VLTILKGAFKGFGKDECGTRAAALAYYTIFALPPLLILLVAIAGKIWGPDQVQRSLEGQFAGMIGQSGAEQVHGMIAHANKTGGRGTLATILGFVGLILGATGAFMSLQDALNHAWEVKPDPKAGGIKNFITKRLLSLGMVLGLGFLLAASLALSAAITAFAGVLGGSFPEGALHALDLVVSLVVLSALFAALFKFLPDAKVTWRDVLVGGFTTALLFVIGKFVIGLYLGHSKPGDSFGAASALAVLLVWVYYAGMIILFGAEFTQEWARVKGAGIEPKEGAIRVVEQQKVVEPDTRTPIAASDKAHAPKGMVLGESKGSGLLQTLLGIPVAYVMLKARGKNPKLEGQAKR
jgi:membrane protein